MKLKGGVKAMKAGVPVTVSAVWCAAVIALRAYHILTLTDPATGFFTDPTHITVPVFYAVAVGGALLLPLLFWLCPLSKAEYVAAAKRPLHALAALAAAFAVGYDAAGQILTPHDTVAAGTGVAAAAASRLPMAAAVTGALAAAALAVVSVSFFTGKEAVKKVRVLLLFPSLWALCKTVAHFAVSVNYMRSAPLLVCVFADVFLMIFLFEYARKLAGYGGDGNTPVCLSCGMLAAGLQLAAALTGLYSQLREEIAFAPLEYYRFAAVLFCVTGVAAVLKNRVPDYVPESEKIETWPLPAENAAPAAEEAPGEDAGNEA